jgi:hypothetical protein
MRYDWLHAESVTASPSHTALFTDCGAGFTDRSRDALFCFRGRQTTVMYLRSPLWRTASRNGDTYHDIDPVGIFMQLTTAA